MRSRNTNPTGEEVVEGIADVVFVVLKWAFLLVFLPTRFLIRKLAR